MLQRFISMVTWSSGEHVAALHRNRLLPGWVTVGTRVCHLGM